ncbi:unnamed protein product [Alopecurus aequalis]
MGTEVLRPHDCLSRVRHHAHAHAGSRRSQRPAARTTRRGQAASSSSPVPRQVRVVKAATDTAYAGPAFGAMSPSPRALPLPRFSFSSPKTAVDATVDDSATRELRRLLGLELPTTN